LQKNPYILACFLYFFNDFMMRYFLVLLVGFCVIGCNSEPEKVEVIDSSGSQKISVDQVQTEPVVEGEEVEKRVKLGVTCGQEQKPVCAKISDRQKNAFLNACEADRHFAEILHEGFCGRQKSVENNCEGRVMGIGNCGGAFVGWEFVDGKCQEVSVSGCDAEIPFESLEACESGCIK
jgi:hypothetical protein